MHAAVLLATIVTLLGGSGPARIEPVDATKAPAVHLRHVHTHQQTSLTFFDADGRLRPQALSELRRFLTDPRTTVDHPIHWRLATLLVAIGAHFPGRPIEVVSGYRHHDRPGHRSNHTHGRAIDMRVSGVDDRELFELLRRSFADIGVGYYPNSTFVHLDVRERSTLWVDYSGSGQTPCYSQTPVEDLRSGVVERLSYEQAIARGCRG